MIGTEIDARYRIEAELGQGGVGTVFRAIRMADGRPVAIKLLKPEFGTSPEQKLRFEREGRALAQLSHPNIVVVMDSGVSGDTPYLVMELLEGETLAERLRRGALSLEEALGVLEPLLSALSYVHEEGLVHRDVKPGNVFIGAGSDGEPQVRLLDFGLAKFVVPEAADRLVTRAGQVFGTPAYMAPEQIAGQEADARADVYATGIILFEMLAGAAPFQGSTSEVMRQQVMEELPLHQIPSQVAQPWVVDLLMKSAAKTRPERFASASDMLGAIAARPRADSMVDGASLDATLEESLELLQADSPGPVTRLVRLVVNVATGAVIVISVGALGAAAFAAHVFTSPDRVRERHWLEGKLGLSLSPAPRPSGAAAPGPPASEASAVGGASRPGALAASAAAPAGSAGPEARPPPAPSARPAAPNPWATVPVELGRYLTKVNRGRALDKRELSKVHRYNGGHPEDPRGHLLLARSHMRRRWLKDAASEFAIACKLDPDARGDPRLLPDLLTLTQLGAADAPRLVGEIFGGEALPPLEALLSRSAPRSGTTAALERARLEKLRGALSSGDRMQ